MITDCCAVKAVLRCVNIINNCSFCFCFTFYSECFERRGMSTVREQIYFFLK